MHKFKYCLLTVVLIFVFCNFASTDVITVKKGPSYYSYVDKVQRYLPNVLIIFTYYDTKGEYYENKIRRTDSSGNLINPYLPVSPGATVDGNIKATYTIPSINSSGLVTDIMKAIGNSGVAEEVSITTNLETVDRANNVYRFRTERFSSDWSKNEKTAVMHIYYLTNKLYSLYQFPPCKTIVVSSSASNSSYFSSGNQITLSMSDKAAFYDAILKHEFGHHIMKENGLFQDTGFSPWGTEPSKLDSAYNEGFAQFMQSQAIVDGVNDCIIHDKERINNAKDSLSFGWTTFKPFTCGNKDYKCYANYIRQLMKGTKNFYQFSGESYPFAIKGALFFSGFNYHKILKSFKSNNGLQSLFKSLKSYYFNEYLNAVGIQYLRGVLSSPLRDISMPTNSKKIPISYDKKVVFNVRSAQNSDFGKFKEDRYHQTIPWEMLKPLGIRLEITQLSEEIAKQLFSKDSGVDSKGRFFYENVWKKNRWEKFPKDIIPNGSSAKIDVEFPESGYYLVRAIAFLDNQINDNLYPLGAGIEFENDRNYNEWFNQLFDSKALYFLEVGSSSVVVSEALIHRLHRPSQTGARDSLVLAELRSSGATSIWNDYDDPWDGLSNCSGVYKHEYQKCVQDTTKRILESQLKGDDYYLGRELIDRAVFTPPESIRSLEEIKTKMKPCYIAVLRGSEPLLPLVEDGRIKDYIDLKLEVVPVAPEGDLPVNKPGRGKDTINLIYNKDYYAFSSNDENLSHYAFIVAPFKKIYDNYKNRLKDGYHTINIETHKVGAKNA